MVWVDGGSGALRHSRESSGPSCRAGRRTEYDIDEGMSQLRAGGFPDVDELLLESLLEPMNADEVADLFERQAADGA